MIVDDLIKSIYNSAISGLLIEQVPNDVPISIDGIEPENIPFSIPNNWKWAKLGDISNYGKNESISGTEIKIDSWILELEDIEKETGVLLNKVKKADRNSISSKNHFYNGDLLYGKLRPYLRKCIIADEEGYCSTEIVPIRFPDFIDKYYIQIVLMSPYFLNYVNSKSYGSKMPRLGTKDAQNALIPLPPINEQRRIVKKVRELLKKTDEIKLIENELTSLNTQFPSEMKKSILQSFMKLSLFYDDNCKWEKFKLKDLVNISTGKKDANYGSETGYYPFFTCSKKPIKCDSYSFDGEAILLAGNGDIGNINYYFGKFEAYQRTYVLMKKNDNINLKFLYYHLLADWKEYNYYKTYGTAIPYIKLGNVQNYFVKVPSIDEQNKIIEEIEKAIPLCDKINTLIN